MWALKTKIKNVRPWIKQNKKKSILLGVLLLVFIFRLFSSGAGDVGRGTPGQVYVTLGEARQGVMRELGRYYGSLSAAKEFSVAPKIGGEVKELLVDIGDMVENGQLLARLDDESFTISRDQAKNAVELNEAQVLEAEANLELAQNDLDRQINLKGKKIVTQSDYEAAENKLRQAQARLEVAQSQLKNAKNILADAELKLSYTKVTASFNGGGQRHIGERLANSGDLVNAGQTLFKVVGLDPLLVVVEVIERDYPKIKVGQTASLRTEAYPKELFSGRVVRVAPVLSADSRQARVELEVKNESGRLKPGMFAEVEFVFEEHQGVWSVPEDVPLRLSQGFVVFVADPKTETVKMLPVTLGLVEKGQVELAGVKQISGPVVFMGQHLLSDGAKYALPKGLEAKSGKKATAQGAKGNKKGGEK